MSTCFFIGHRDAPDSILPSLSSAIEKRITDDDVDQFVIGAYGRFDSLAAQAVRMAKKQHQDAKASVNDIAVLAGISKASVFQYFGSKNTGKEHLRSVRIKDKTKINT